jgi:hypothetical protein
MKLIFNWRMAALCLVLGLATIAFQHVQVARATSSPTFYPVGASSYAGYPCPSNIKINGTDIPIGANCSSMNNTVAYLSSTPQSDQTGASVVIGPNWTQQCRGTGDAKSLGSYTWSGKLPGGGQNTGAIFMHTFPNVCGSASNFDVMIVSSKYSDGWQWIIKLYIPG